MVQLSMVSDTYTDRGGKDYLDFNQTERLYDTPVSIARLWRGYSYTKTMTVSAEGSYDVNHLPLTYRWVVLRGDPSHVRITSLNDSQSRVQIDLDYHSETWIPDVIHPDQVRSTNLVVVGAFVNNGYYWSAPGMITSYTFPNERRLYDPATHQLREVNYEDRLPTQTYDKSWNRDVFHYDSSGVLQGLTRSAGLVVNQFTADGYLVTAKDNSGRVTQVQSVQYAPAAVVGSADYQRMTWRASGSSFSYTGNAVLPNPQAPATVADPQISPPPGTYTDTSLTVTLQTATANATMRYSTERTQIFNSSYPVYTGPFQIDHNSKIQVRGSLAGMADSAVVTAEYHFKLPTPAISPAGGNFGGPVVVTLACANPHSAIYYTLDGSSPANQANLYKSPILISRTATLKVQAVGPHYDMDASDIASADFTIASTPSPPVILRQPGPSLSVLDGNFAVFELMTAGNPAVTYQWYRDGVLLPGEAQPTLSYAVNINSEGQQVYAVVSNSNGSVQSQTTVVQVRLVAPRLTQLPQDTVVNVGETAHFGVAATGSYGIHYQWQIRTPTDSSFADSPGATSVNFDIANVRSTDHGTQVRCIVANGGGRISSLPATLKVYGNEDISPGWGSNTNLAEGKPSDQSSRLSGYAMGGAAAAVDGNTDGNFFDGSVTHTNVDSNAWWQVDLGGTAVVSSIVVWGRTDACCISRLSDYWVFVSENPFLATDTPATLQGRPGTFSSHQTTAPSPSTAIAMGANGRYVRVQLSGTNNLSLAEVQVFGSGGVPAPPVLSQRKEASQSSTLSGYAMGGAAAAVDGNTDGNFFDGSVTHTNVDGNAWWLVDLGASAPVSSVVVWNRTDACCVSRLSDYWVFVSDTPFLATDTPATLQGRPGTFSSHQSTAPNPSATIGVGSPGRYVRVQLSGTGNLSLAEVQVFGQ